MSFENSSGKAGAEPLDLCAHWKIPRADRQAFLIGTSRYPLANGGNRNREAGIRFVFEHIGTVINGRNEQNKWLRTHAGRLGGKTPLKLLMEGSTQSLSRLKEHVMFLSSSI